MTRLASERGWWRCNVMRLFGCYLQTNGTHWASLSFSRCRSFICDICKRTEKLKLVEWRWCITLDILPSFHQLRFLCAFTNITNEASTSRERKQGSVCSVYNCGLLCARGKFQSTSRPYSEFLIDWLTALRHISTERLLVPRNVAKLDMIKIRR